MSTDPTQITTKSFSEGIWLRNTALSSGSVGDVFLRRGQEANWEAMHNTTKQYEIANKGAVGVVSEPTEYRIRMTENVHDLTAGMTLAGVNPSTGSGYWVSNFLNQSLAAFLVRRNANDSVFEEVAITGIRLEEIRFQSQMNGAATFQYTFRGTSGSFYNAAGSYPHPLWGAQDNDSPGGITGKDIRVVLGSTNVAGSKAYRVQSTTVTAAFPTETVKEHGRRSSVGVVSDVADVTAEFELLPADLQPHDVFYPVSNDGGVAKYALDLPQTTNMFLNVYDPDLPESNTIICSLKIPNVKPTADTLAGVRVRQNTTARFTLTNTSEGGTENGGLIVSKTEIAS